MAVALLLPSLGSNSVTLKRVAFHTSQAHSMLYTPATCIQGYGRVPHFYVSDP